MAAGSADVASDSLPVQALRRALWDAVCAVAESLMIKMKLFSAKGAVKNGCIATALVSLYLSLNLCLQCQPHFSVQFAIKQNVIWRFKA